MTEKEMFEKNTDLEFAFMRYILDHPDILDTLPSDFQLLILPKDDPELAECNQKLLQQHNFGKPIVVVKMKTPKNPTARVSELEIQLPEHA